EVPGGLARPAAQGVRATQADRAGLVGADPAEPIVEHAVDAGGGVDAGVLGGRVVDQPTQVVDGLDRFDALPEQVRRVHLGPDVGGVDGLDQPQQRGGVVDHVVRVHFDGDPDV